MNQILENIERQRATSYLSFNLGCELFAVPLGRVQEIIKMKPVIPVVDGPDYIRGLINLRGTTFNVIDTRVKVGLHPKPIDENSCIIILTVLYQNNYLRIGALTDNINSVNEIQDNSVENPQYYLTGIKPEYITGIARENGNTIRLLDVDSIFNNFESDDTSLIAPIRITKNFI